MVCGLVAFLSGICSDTQEITYSCIVVLVKFGAYAAVCAVDCNPRIRRDNARITHHRYRCAGVGIYLYPVSEKNTAAVYSA